MPNSSHYRVIEGHAILGSTNSRLCSQLSSFFFQPVQLELELADLLEKFRLVLLILLGLSPPTVAKALGHPFDGLFLPGCHLVRMHIKPARQFGQSPLPLNCRQSDFRTEGPRKCPPFPYHEFAS